MKNFIVIVRVKLKNNCNQTIDNIKQLKPRKDSQQQTHDYRTRPLRMEIPHAIDRLFKTLSHILTQRSYTTYNENFVEDTRTGQLQYTLHKLVLYSGSIVSVIINGISMVF